MAQKSECLEFMLKRGFGVAYTDTIWNHFFRKTVLRGWRVVFLNMLFTICRYPSLPNLLQGLLCFTSELFFNCSVLTVMYVYTYLYTLIHRI